MTIFGDISLKHNDGNVFEEELNVHLYLIYNSPSNSLHINASF